MKTFKEWSAEPITKGWYTKLCVISMIISFIIGAIYWFTYFTEIPDRIREGCKNLTRKIFRKRIPTK